MPNATETLNNLGCTVEDITNWLYQIVKSLTPEDDFMDVRLCVSYDKTRWYIFTGSPDYDPWHGFCGADSIGAHNSYADCKRSAEMMYDEVWEHMDAAKE